MVVSNSPHLFAQENLTQNQLEAITLARKNGVYVRVLDLDVADVPRTLVLLGETHQKSQKLFTAEAQFLSHFNFRFIEGWGGTGVPPNLRDRAFSLWQIPLTRLAPFLTILQTDLNQKIEKLLEAYWVIVPCGDFYLD